MDLFESASNTIKSGVENISSAVSESMILRSSFVRDFIKLCNDGWQQGWHERNGGNLTYRLTKNDVEEIKKYLDQKKGQWCDMGVEDKTLADSYFLTTGSGRYMKNVKKDPLHNIGLVEINSSGNSYRIVWGLNDGGVPTSEFPTHYLNHVVRVKESGDKCRLIYHAHPENIIAMTFVCPLDSKYFSRALWQAMTECIVIFPTGVGVVPWMVPGGSDIARATSKLMTKFDAVIWAQHGLFVSGNDFDSTFSLMHTIEKAASIYCKVRSMNMGSDIVLNTITDENLKQIAKDFNLLINEEFLK